MTLSIPYEGETCLLSVERSGDIDVTIWHNHESLSAFDVLSKNLY